MVKINNNFVGQLVEFYFIDNKIKGTVMDINTKDNTVDVKTNNGITHKVFFSEKESKFCYFNKI